MTSADEQSLDGAPAHYATTAEPQRRGGQGCESLRELWGPVEDSAEHRQADAWARRSLGVAAAPGDAELLAEVDAATADKYGVRLRAS
ncbi:hypothetical protein HUT06_21255 [Actinomadura sp. NAK00032]|uniref:hypothetical protein n=1 Tax=Actinomadura sp. NAK00032 TaxID=2742128 RepID=UPI0015914202|nr:hypothetical protein [Actinomadura sp. NAK00032]QKW36248.1 hypothetical protein HUT06_21255 [Actinomadura sp. NAK00032]